MSVRGSVREWALRIRDVARWRGRLTDRRLRTLARRTTALEGAVGNASDGRRIEALECSARAAVDLLRELERRTNDAEFSLHRTDAHDAATDPSVGALQHQVRGLLDRLGNLEDDVERYQDGC